ncbi:MAG: hypothetical protein LBR19_08390 [Bifidobacteriaceae bacterium]|jgi:hypothetical protein|nr:hypothetical protein [Bifidobacteriaceae bacterium]
MTTRPPRFAIALTTAALAALTLAGCGGDNANSGPPVEDTGTVPPAVVVSIEGISEDDPDYPLNEQLVVSPEVGSGWISAPWGLAGETSASTTAIQLVYVAGETVCYGHAGFTVSETDDRVTIGSYLVKVDEPAGECQDGLWARKAGTITLSEPLGTRALYHAGVDALFDGYSFGLFDYTEEPTAPTAAPSTQVSTEDTTQPADDPTSIIDEATEPSTEAPDAASGTPETSPSAAGLE